MNPTVSSWLAQEHVRDLRAAADHWRLATTAQPAWRVSWHRAPKPAAAPASFRTWFRGSRLPAGQQYCPSC